jgi:acetyltransferase-like isoleucine patch superfamily enzyme
MKKLFLLYKRCRTSGSLFLVVVFRLILNYLLYGKRLLLHQHVIIRGTRNIEVPGKLEVGIRYVGFVHRREKTYLNIRGRLKIADEYYIGRGCRFDIGENGVVTIGRGGYLNCHTKVIIMHRLTIGDQCAISWDCQFLDEDFHDIRYQGKEDADHSITIGNNVWIGCGARIYKGTVIPDGCVVASDSVVKGVFRAENALIGGNPAKVIREDISWV